jgi:hypothetical protein
MMRGSSISITIIKISAVHNLGVNNAKTKIKIIFEIVRDYFFTMDSGAFLVFKNRCTKTDNSQINKSIKSIKF